MRLIYTTNKGNLILTGRLMSSPRMILHGWVKINSSRLNENPVDQEITQDGRLLLVRWNDGSSETYRITMNQPVAINNKSFHNNK